jgi:serine/threonine protein kinase
VNASLRELFREVADIPEEERESVLARRRVSAATRAEVESLLRYDSASGESLTRRVSGAAADTLLWSNPGVPRYCGAYRLISLLGYGGMGAVYLAERRDGEIEQRVAIKLLRADADRPAWRDRFLRERQLLAYLNHPAIARLLDAGHTVDGQPYLAMEYVDGEAIDEYAAPLDLRAQLRLFLSVCEGVSHAHRRLIIHRDLKPSNILVDAAGQPKLLDFGIAKLLDTAATETRTAERLLTPGYASPEQLRGEGQTTATDIYSLGAVLYKLLTGRAPRELFPGLVTERTFLREHSVTAPSRVNPALPRDIDHILRKALRHEPHERYASVDAFAEDIQAFLESRPVQARSAETWYRLRKLVSRHRAGVIAATVTAAGLWIGSEAIDRQRELAQTRFLQARQLANKVLALDEAGALNSSRDMHDVVAMSKDYLEALAAQGRKDEALALEVVNGYSVLARAQGITMAASSGQRARAEDSLRKASIFVEPILHARPSHRKALLSAARISHDRMILAENERRNGEVLAEAGRAVGYLERFLSLGEPNSEESDVVSELFYNIALSHKNQYLPDEGIRYARRSVETSGLSHNAALRRSLALSMLADLLRRTGDLEGALVAIREARANLDKARFPSEKQRRAAWCRVLGRESKILGVPGAISLNRPNEALPLLERVFGLLEEWSQSEQRDTWSRLLFASVGRELGDTLRLRNPQRALDVYDHALRRLGEVEDNTEARRGEVELLASSAYALRSLKRVEEAKARIDAAFRLLAGTGDYPAARVLLHEGAEAALRSWGDHLAETGEPERAAEVYEELLAKVLVTEPDSRNDLPHAAGLSRIYGPLAALHRRNGQRDRAASFDALRLELWRHWDRKLPNNVFVRGQLESARKG